MAVCYSKSLIEQPGVAVQLTVDFSKITKRVRTQLINALRDGYAVGGKTGELQRLVFGNSMPTHRVTYYNATAVDKAWFDMVPQDVRDAALAASALEGGNYQSYKAGEWHAAWGSYYLLRISKRASYNLLTLKDSPAWQSKVAQLIKNIEAGFIFTSTP